MCLRDVTIPQLTNPPYKGTEIDRREFSSIFLCFKHQENMYIYDSWIAVNNEFLVTREVIRQ